MTERWHLNGFNLCEAIVIRTGPDGQGRNYIDGRHQISVGRFDTVDEARRAVDEHNAALGHDSP
jgi:hypothetical protein